MVKKGYKLTEVGEIPEDWDQSNLGEYLKGNPKYGINAPAVALKGNLPTYIRITDISDDGRFKPSPEVGVDHPDTSNYRLKAGDLLFARTGASVGKSYLYREEDGPLVYAGFLIKVSPDPSQLSPSFLSQYVKSKPYWRWIELMSMRSGQPGVNGNEYSQLPIPVPLINEQEEIAKALSDVDELIALLENLIAKKRDIKAATMQQLLTGKKRLPGFGEGKGYKQTELGEIPEDWELSVLSKHCDFITKGSTPTTYGFSWVKDGILFLRSECVSENGLDLSESMHISEQAHSVLKRSEVKSGDLLITITGNVGRYIKLPEQFPPANINQHIARVRVNCDRVNSDYLYFYLTQTSVRKQYESITTGQAYPQLSLKQVRETKIMLPALLEQEAVSEALSGMHLEIRGLEDTLDKTKAIKQGMMQELLTGRTRLFDSQLIKNIARER